MRNAEPGKVVREGRHRARIGTVSELAFLARNAGRVRPELRRLGERVNDGRVLRIDRQNGRRVRDGGHEFIIAIKLT